MVTIDNEPMISTSISPRVRIPHSANNKIGYTTNYNTLHYMYDTLQNTRDTLQNTHDTLQSTIPTKYNTL